MTKPRKKKYFAFNVIKIDHQQKFKYAYKIFDLRERSPAKLKEDIPR